TRKSTSVILGEKKGLRGSPKGRAEIGYAPVRRVSVESSALIGRPLPVEKIGAKLTLSSASRSHSGIHCNCSSGSSNTALAEKRWTWLCRDRAQSARALFGRNGCSSKSEPSSCVRPRL